VGNAFLSTATYGNFYSESELRYESARVMRADPGKAAMAAALTSLQG
jgi:hypothetical protein